MRLEIKTISSLEKVMSHIHCNCGGLNSASVLKNEVFSYQIAFKNRESNYSSKELSLEIISDIADCISVYNVRYVPVLTNCYKDQTDKGLFAVGIQLLLQSSFNASY